jgi:hypothetical protein
MWYLFLATFRGHTNTSGTRVRERGSDPNLSFGTEGMLEREEREWERGGQRDIWRQVLPAALNRSVPPAVFAAEYRRTAADWTVNICYT